MLIQPSSVVSILGSKKVWERFTTPPDTMRSSVRLESYSHPLVVEDIVAEWLRRWIANPLLYERESSNLSDVDIFLVYEVLQRE